MIVSSGDGSVEGGIRLLMMVSSRGDSAEGDIRLMMVSPTPRSLPQLGQKLSVDDIGLSQCGQFMNEAPFVI